MTNEMQHLIEQQINKELYSAYLYYDIAEYYRKKGLDGFHKWFEEQAREEIEHAEKFAEYMHDTGIGFKLLAIDAPESNFNDLRDPLVLQAEHEHYVTELIYGIYKQACADDDIAVRNFIQWYITEQMEEEKKAKDLLERYDLFAKDNVMGLYAIDKELGK